jgi:hypothetical protein
VARKASGACPVDLKVSKSQTTHALCLLSRVFFSGSRVSGNHVGHSKRRTRNKGGRHLVDIIGDFSWTKGVTSRGHFW